MAVLAAGMSTRYGRLKQLEPVGPSGEALLDYALFDGYRTGFRRVVMIIREELEEAFREHGRGWWPLDLEVVFHHQRRRDLPGGVHLRTAHGEQGSGGGERPSLEALASAREKPWGTAHALLTARHLFPGPFVVLNADDFYGASAYAQAMALMDRDLKQESGGSPVYGLVAYTLADTLSRHGGVSRGICSVNGKGWLEEVQEVLGIRRREGEISGTTVQGEDLLLTGQEPISTNFWIFTPEIFPYLEEGFQAFLEARLKEGPGAGEAEFLIPLEVNRMLSRREARVWVLRTQDPFFGITHPMDWESVAGGLQELIREGRYPESLWSGG